MFELLYKDFVDTFFNGVFLGVFDILFITSPVWLPLLLLVIFWKSWVTYVQKKYILDQEYVLLEIRLPTEITKTPLAMEAVLNGLHYGPGEATWINRYWQGQVRPWWSLEMVSIEGEVHFYIWTRKFYKNNVEAQIYAQYPSVEIYEVDDYSRNVDFEIGKSSLWGCDFTLTKQDAYPIKTYIDYGLDSAMIKEEQKVDPLASIIEFLGNIGKGEQIWIQIIIRQTKDERKEKPGKFFSKKVGWKDEARTLVKKLRDETIRNPKAEHPDLPTPTRGEEDTMTAIERSVAKNGFDTGIRGLYFAEGDKFDPANISGLTSMYKQFSSNQLNGFKPTRWLTIFDWPWQDFRDIRKNTKKAKMLRAYRKRSWFHPPHKTSSYVLNTEELATIFHFPGGVVQAPSVSRITSRRGEAPANLPM